jgi:hypothetical protein
MKFGKIALLLVLLISFLFIQQSSSNLWPWMGGEEEEGANPSEGQEGGEHDGQEGEEGQEEGHGQEGAGSGENPGQSVEGITELTDDNFDKFLVGKKAVLVGMENLIK